MSHVLKGMGAAFIATVVLSALMVMKSMMGLMPGLDLPKMIAGMMGTPGTPAVGWAVHFMIGTLVYGLAISLLEKPLPGDNHVVHGLILSVIFWLVMMVMLMPMAGAGLFGMQFGIMGPVMTLMLHLIFGAVLGWVYGRLVHGESITHHRSATAH